jgi:hypothetical protein
MLSSFYREIAGVSGLKPDWGPCRSADECAHERWAHIPATHSGSRRQSVAELRSLLPYGSCRSLDRPAGMRAEDEQWQLGLRVVLSDGKELPCYGARGQATAAPNQRASWFRAKIPKPSGTQRPLAARSRSPCNHRRLGSVMPSEP